VLIIILTHSRGIINRGWFHQGMKEGEVERYRGEIERER
jgi:hypothetical protein